MSQTFHLFKKLKAFLILFAKGFVLGLSMALPGISAGTMAFVLGIYEKLIQELSFFSIGHWARWIKALSLKLSKNPKNQIGNQTKDQTGNQTGNQIGNQTKDQTGNQIGNQTEEKTGDQSQRSNRASDQRANREQIGSKRRKKPFPLTSTFKPEFTKKLYGFWLPLSVGGLSALFCFVGLAPSFIEDYSLEFYSLMFGLIAGSALIPLKEMKKSVKNWSLVFLSLSLSLILLKLAEHKSVLAFEGFASPKPWALFLAGAFSGGALIIPGLSGSSLLLIFGLYEPVLQTFKSLDLLAAAAFCLGAGLGLIALSAWIRPQLEQRFEESMAVISGLLLAGLTVVFPLSFSMKFPFFEGPTDGLIEGELTEHSVLKFLILALSGFVAFLGFSSKISSKFSKIFSKLFSGLSLRFLLGSRKNK